MLFDGICVRLLRHLKPQIGNFAASRRPGPFS
jgi:hypothetical protein